MSYLQQKAAEEARNFDSDSRVIAGGRSDWFLKLNESKRLALVEIFDDEEDCEIEVVLPFKYEVCSTCNGKGTHVNPSIDAGGLSADDFREDPDFAEDYFGGTYDVSCYECHGKNVVPEVDTKNLTPEQKVWHERLIEMENDRAAWDAEARAERAMGA